MISYAICDGSGAPRSGGVTTFAVPFGLSLADAFVPEDIDTSRVRAEGGRGGGLVAFSCSRQD